MEYKHDSNFTKYEKATPDKFENYLFEIALFAYNTSIQNVGFCLGMEAFPENAKEYSKRVFNAHNMSTDDNLAMNWRGRMNDDLINALDVFHTGGYEISFNFMSLVLAPTQIGNKENKEKYSLYLKEAEKIPEIIFAGRLGEYQYYDMDDTIENALKLSEKLLWQMK